MHFATARRSCGRWQAAALRAPQSMAEDVHALKGVNCHDCHGGDPVHLTTPGPYAGALPEGDVSPFRRRRWT